MGATTNWRKDLCTLKIFSSVIFTGCFTPSQPWRVISTEQQKKVKGHITYSSMILNGCASYSVGMQKTEEKEKSLFSWKLKSSRSWNPHSQLDESQSTDPLVPLVPLSRQLLALGDVIVRACHVIRLGRLRWQRAGDVAIGQTVVGVLCAVLSLQAPGPSRPRGPVLLPLRLSVHRETTQSINK